MKLIALLSACLVAAIIAATPAHALTTPVGAHQACTSTSQQSPGCCETPSVEQAAQADYSSQENCGERFGIVKAIIPIIGIILLAGGIIGAVIWERRRLS